MTAPHRWATSPRSVHPPTAAGSPRTEASTRKLDQAARSVTASAYSRASTAPVGSFLPQPRTATIDAARNVRSPATSSTLTSPGPGRPASSPFSSRARICTASICLPPAARSAASVSGGRVADETHQATPGLPHRRTRPATSPMTSAAVRSDRDRVTWAAGKAGSSAQSG